MVTRDRVPAPTSKPRKKRKRPVRAPKIPPSGLVLAEPAVDYGAATQGQVARPFHAGTHGSPANAPPESAGLERRTLRAATAARMQTRQARAANLAHASSHFVGQLRKLIAQELKRIDEPRTARLDARLTAKERALIQRAADISGRSLSDFVVQAAHQAALHEIEHQVILRLSRRDSATIAAALHAEPPEPTAAFKRAVALRDKVLGRPKPQKD